MISPARSFRFLPPLALNLLACASSYAAGPPAAAPGPQDDHDAPVRRRAPDDLRSREALAVELFQKAAPTVVEISATTTRPGPQGPVSEGSIGTGVLISADHHVLTAAHVVDGAEMLVVKTADGKERMAERVFSEPAADVALIRLTEADPSLEHAVLGDSDRLAVGQDLFVIGNPRGLSSTFTSGILSGFRDFAELYGGTVLVEFLQTDAAINSGNSGGPIFDSGGRVVGIASRISTRSGGSEGLGFAVAINSIKQLLALENRTWTGMRSVFLSAAQLRILMQLDAPGALLVQAVETDSPASRAGLLGGSVPATIAGRDLLLGGDLIIELNGQEACHARCLAASHDALNAADQILVRFLRHGELREVTLDVRDSRQNFLR